MARKTKNTMTKIIKALATNDERIKTLTLGEGENAIEIHCKTYLPFIDMTAMVNDILDFVFLPVSEDSDELKYHPELISFAIDFEIINYFTDIILPDDGDKVYEFLKQTNIVSHITSAVPDATLEIIEAAMDAIEYKKQQMLKKGKFDTLLSGISGLVNSLGGYAENMTLSDIADQFPELKDQFGSLLTSLSNQNVAEESSAE